MYTPNCTKTYDTTDSINNISSIYCSFNEKFIFPSPPRLCDSESSCSVSYHSDSSYSDGKLMRSRHRARRKSTKLPPIGVFWDIENCRIPKVKCAISVVQRIRELFYTEYREAEFLVVCDVKKENTQLVSELHDAQINVIHVSSTSKNAADDKLRQSLRRFADIFKPPAAIALISSDINFASDLSDLRYRKKIHVILIHNNNVADALILCANKTYNFGSIVESAPLTGNNKNEDNLQADLYVFNLPVTFYNDSSWIKSLKCRLKYLSDNCGGKVLSVHGRFGIAIIRFGSLSYAKRYMYIVDDIV